MTWQSPLTEPTTGTPADEATTTFPQTIVNLNTQNSVGTNTWSLTTVACQPFFSLVTTSNNVARLDHVAAVDYETNPSFSCVVSVTDSDAPATVLTKTINIAVTNRPDSPPSFTAATFACTSVEESAATTVLSGCTISFTDPDAGESWFCSIYGPNAAYFTVSTNVAAKTCVVAVAAKYDRDTIPGSLPATLLSFFVRVTDTTGRTSSSQVDVTFTDINDNTPTCIPPIRYNYVPENAPSGSTVTTIACTDKDDGVNAALQYTITSQTTAGEYAININSGLLTVTAALNYDMASPNSQITISVVDQGTTPLTTVITVNVIVTSINEFPPVWGVWTPAVPATGSITTIAENIVTGTQIFKATATDADWGVDGVLFYTLTSVTGGGTVDLSTAFTIDANTGAVKKSGPTQVDAESYASISFDVQVSDRGSPARFIIQTVTVDVTDVNEHPPVFVNTFVAVNIPERHNAGAVHDFAPLSDADLTVTPIVCAIVGGNADGFFAIDATIKTKIVTVAVGPNPDKPANNLRSYTLNIECRDQGGVAPYKASRAILQVSVPATNDNNPTLTGTATLTLPENQAMGNVMVLTPGDNDNDYGGKYTCTITPPTAFFVVTSDCTGLILQKALDFEVAPTSYTLTITITDDGGLTAATPLSIAVTITNVNDNMPSCTPTQQTLTIDENIAPLTAIASLVCTDADETTAPYVTLSLLNAAAVPFDLSASGVLTIKTAAVIDYDAASAVTTYSLTARATDKMDVTSWRDSYINVHVLPLEDNVPVFPAAITIAIPENTVPGNIVTTFLATDADKPPHGIKSYAIGAVDNGGTGLFMVDNAGNIRLAPSALLDYDTMPALNKNYVVQLTATDGTTIVTGTVTVQIQDINDNKPTFNTFLYVDTVAENVAAGTASTISFTVTDGDEADTTFAFSKVAGSGDPSAYFDVNPTTGAITRSAVTGLSHVSSPVVGFNVITTDRTAGLVLTGTAQILITVTDANLATPACAGGPTYAMNKPENTALGATIDNLSLVCSDGDPGQNLSYSVVTANAYFSVDYNSGVVTLIKKLDFETAPGPQSIVIRVSDDHAVPQFVDITIDVTVLNIDEERPVCASIPRMVTILENAIVTASVFNVGTCTDVDSTTFDFQITAVDGAAGSGPFLMNLASGATTLAAALDYETKTTYAARVTIVDTTSNPCLYTTTYTVFVAVLPVNENPPTNPNVAATVTIPENAPIGQVLAVIVPALSATDSDTGSNHGVILWDIVGGNPKGYFSIDPKTAVITVAYPLDFEVDPLISLVVQPKDAPGLLAAQTTTIDITVTDANDNKPEFSTKRFHVNIVAGTAPTTLRDFTGIVTDADSGANGNFALSLNTGANPIFLQSGMLLTTQVPMPSSPIQYVVEVLAIDNGTPKLTSTATVTVHVVEANLNTPNVGPDSSVTIPETTAIGGIVYSTAGTDLDPGRFGTPLTYSLTTDTSAGLFLIDPVTGEIRTTTALDFETMTSPWTLVVHAEDSGGLSDDVTLTFILVDSNENDPQFQAAPANTFVTTVDENLVWNTVINNVKWFDPDEGGLQTVNCYIKSQTGGDHFWIDPLTCDIAINNTLDRETNTEHLLVVELRDSGMPILTSEKSFVVIVNDINDNSPTFSTLSAGLNAKVAENAGTGVYVTTVGATDRDAGVNSAITYSLAGPNAASFAIDATSGVITTAASFDAETTPTISVIAVASDGGATVRSGTMTVTVTIGDVDDNIPILTGNPYAASIPEDSGVGTSVKTIVAADADVLFGVLSYAITAGDAGGFFRVLPNGLVETKLIGLDRETTPTITLTVTVSDNAATPNTVDATLVITLTDVNDNPPTVPTTAQLFSIMENSPVNSPVTQSLTNITDIDAPPINNLLVYDIDAIIVGPDYYKIDTTTGQLSVKVAKLDREKTEVSTLRLRVMDSGVPVLTSYFLVNITLIDENDNDPQFSAAYLNSSVAENLAVSSTVITTVATDIDLGINAALLYSLDPSYTVAVSMFAIDINTGLITLTSPLDYETTTYYTFKVIAKDQGVPQRTGTAFVFVEVTDVNDNAPVIQPTFVSAEVPMLDDGRMTITQLGYTDPDTGAGGQAHFQWTTVINLFTINPTSGSIHRNPKEDLVNEKIYTQYVSSTDLGSPSLSSITPSTVRIDTFPPEYYVIMVTFSISMTNFETYSDSIREGMRKILANRYPYNRIGLWTAVEQGSSVVGYYYAVKNREADTIANIDRTKEFVSKEDLLLYFRNDASGRPVAGMSGTDFVNSVAVLVEPYHSADPIMWYETAGGIAGLFFACLLGAGLLAGMIAGIVICCRTATPPTSTIQSVAPKAVPKSNPVATTAEKPTSKILELNRGKHPEKPSEIQSQEKPSPSQDQTSADPEEKVYDPETGQLVLFNIEKDVYKAF